MGVTAHRLWHITQPVERHERVHAPPHRRRRYTRRRTPPWPSVPPAQGRSMVIVLHARRVPLILFVEPFPFRQTRQLHLKFKCRLTRRMPRLPSFIGQYPFRTIQPVSVIDILDEWVAPMGGDCPVVCHSPVCQTCLFTIFPTISTTIRGSPFWEHREKAGCQNRGGAHVVNNMCEKYPLRIG